MSRALFALLLLRFFEPGKQLLQIRLPLLGAGRLGGFVTVARYGGPRDVDGEISLPSGGMKQLLACLVRIPWLVGGGNGLLTDMTTFSPGILPPMCLAAMLLNASNGSGDVLALPPITVGGTTEPVGV